MLACLLACLLASGWRTEETNSKAFMKFAKNIMNGSFIVVAVAFINFHSVLIFEKSFYDTIKKINYPLLLI